VKLARARIVLSGRTGLLALLGLYLLARLVILVVTLTQGHVFVADDTASYVEPAVSLTGHSPRLWGVPLFYRMLGTDGLRAAGQWLIGTGAWAGLAWVVWTLLRAPAARLAGAAAVLLLALHDAVGNWDFAMLSESLSVSLGVLAFALLLRFAATGSVPALVGLTVAGFWWTFTRPDIRVFTVFLVVVLAFLTLRKLALRKQALRKRAYRTRRWAGAVAAGVLVLAIGWCSAIVPVVTESARASSSFGAAHSYDEWILFRLRVQVLPDPAIKAVFTDQLGLPACPAAEAIAAKPDWDIQNFADAYYACPELKAWGDANRDTVFNRFAAVAPGQYSRMTVGLVNESMLGGTYADVPSVLPPPLQKLAFPGIRWALVAVLLYLVVALAAVLVTRARRSHRLLVDGAAGLLVVCVVSTGAGVIFGTGEFWRFGLQEAVGIRLAVLLLAAAAFDAYLQKRGISQATDTTTPAEGESSVYARH
jgi:hypothetical protein